MKKLICPECGKELNKIAKYWYSAEYIKVIYSHENILPEEFCPINIVEVEELRR